MSPGHLEARCGRANVTRSPRDLTNGPIEGQQRATLPPDPPEDEPHRSPDSEQFAADRNRAANDGELAVGVNVHPTS